jgi:WD40 repeat protein
MKCLEKDRTRRYETANGLASDVKRHLSNEPIQARPPSLLYTCHKLARRHRGAFAAAAVVLVTLAVGLGGVFWQWRRAEAKATESRESLARLYVAQGNRLVEEDDPAGALLWFVEALKKEEGKAEREDIHQLRLALTLMQCPKPVYLQQIQGAEAAEFSPDGRRLLAVLTNQVGVGNLATITQTLRIWDVATGQSKDLYTGSLRFARFCAEGRFVVSAHEMSTPNLITELRIHEPSVDQAPSRTTWITGRLFDRDVYASTDGQNVFISGANGIQVWDLATGQVVSLSSNAGSVSQIGPSAFSPDGSRFLSVNQDRTVQVLETTTGRPLAQPLPHPGMFDPRFAWAQFDHSGQRALTVAYDSTYDPNTELRLWDTAGGKPELPTLRQVGAVRAADFSPDGRFLIATGNHVEGSRIWDTTTGHVIRRLPVEANGRDVQFSPDGRHVLSGGDAAVRLWNPASGLPVTSPLWQRGRWSRFRFTQDGRYVLNASPDEARVWDLRRGQVPGWQQRHGEHGELRFSRDGKLLASFTDVAGDATVKVWDIASGTAAWPEFESHNATARAMAFSSDGLRVIVASHQSGSDVITNQVWDARSGRPVGLPFITEDPRAYLELSMDGHRALVSEWRGTGENSWRLIDLTIGRPLVRIPTNFCGRGWLSSNGRFVLFSENATPANSTRIAAQVFDALSGEPVSRVMMHGGRINTAAFSPDGKRVATTTAEGITRIWDTTSGRPLTSRMRLGGSIVPVFSPDGQKLVTAGYGSPARIWAVRIWDTTTGRLLTKPMVHENNVVDASFSPDGRLLLTRSRGAYLWDTATGERIAELLPEAAAATFGPAGRQVATRSGEYVHLLNLPDVKLAPDEWLALGRLLSGREFDGKDGLTPVQERDDSFIDLAPELLQSLFSKLGFSPKRQANIVRLNHESLQGSAGDAFPPSQGALARWHQEQSEEAERDQSWFAASFHLGRLAAMHTNDTDVRLRWAMAMIRQGAWSEVAAKQPALAGLVPPHDPKTPPELIDLSAYYNAPLSIPWLATLPGEQTTATLASLPRGAKEWGGIRFDVRGIVQTGSWRWGPYEYSRRAEGIRIQQTCRALWFLHASIHGSFGEGSNEPVADGTEVGCYVVHYSDGRQGQWPIIYGRDLRSWAVPSRAPEKATEAELAWTAETEGTRLRLYKSRWPNPIPDVRIESIDLVLRHNDAAPFLIALTAEPLAAERSKGER